MRWKFVFAGVVWGLVVYGIAPARFHVAADVAAACAKAVVTPPRRPQVAAPELSTPNPSDYVEIDGSKNPEMIPQWSSWEFAFRLIAGGSKLLPSSVHHVVSKEEAAIILAEAEASEQRDVACRERILKLRPLMQTEKLSVLIDKQREIQLDCRWQTLHARDRLLERLQPEGRAALVAFVEDLKTGRKVTVSKKELTFYRQPQ